MAVIDDPSRVGVWIIAAAATAGVIVRPFRWPEAVWAVGGAALLVACGLLPWSRALDAVAKGNDVYLFLVGMMLLSETARREGLFDRVASMAVRHARGSPGRLFLSIYVVGVVVTTFLSNDATAVVLTPAVYAATRKAGVRPLPYLFVCAFVANAASFVLPISNPANIVLYGDHTPPLGPWLAHFGLPAALAIVATWFALRWTEGRGLEARCADAADLPPMTRGTWTATAGLATTAVVLLIVSALDIRLGLPTAVMGVVTTAIVVIATRASPVPAIRGVSWSVLPLVAGLFVLVEALAATGLIAELARVLAASAGHAPRATPWLAGLSLAIVSNAMNNLPAGLIASAALALAKPSTDVVDALLIGVDLGPNLSITGSLATILWLTAIRREGEDVGFWRFLKLGVLVTTPALLLALAGRLLIA